MSDDNSETSADADLQSTVPVPDQMSSRNGKPDVPDETPEKIPAESPTEVAGFSENSVHLESSAGFRSTRQPVPPEFDVAATAGDVFATPLLLGAGDVFSVGNGLTSRWCETVAVASQTSDDTESMVTARVRNAVIDRVSALSKSWHRSERVSPGSEKGSSGDAVPIKGSTLENGSSGMDSTIGGLVMECHGEELAELGGPDAASALAV